MDCRQDACAPGRNGLLSIEEAVHGSVHGDADNAPDAAHDELAQYEAQEKWYGLTMGFDAATFENDPFGEEAEHYGEPEDVHGPTAGYGVSRRMERPPEELHSHKH